MITDHGSIYIINLFLKNKKYNIKIKFLFKIYFKISLNQYNIYLFKYILNNFKIIFYFIIY